MKKKKREIPAMTNYQTQPISTITNLQDSNHIASKQIRLTSEYC
jgi:hypothetical protein